MDIKELVAGFISFFFGVVVLVQITKALNFQLGSLIVAIFIILGLVWFIKQVFSR